MDMVKATRARNLQVVFFSSFVPRPINVCFDIIFVTVILFFSSRYVRFTEQFEVSRVIQLTKVCVSTNNS
jgi:hypothetical protein